MQYDVTNDSDHRIYMKVQVAVARTWNSCEVNGEVALYPERSNAFVL